MHLIPYWRDNVSGDQRENGETKIFWNSYKVASVAKSYQCRYIIIIIIMFNEILWYIVFKILVTTWNLFLLLTEGFKSQIFLIVQQITEKSGTTGYQVMWYDYYQVHNWETASKRTDGIRSSSRMMWKRTESRQFSSFQFTVT